ncbi:MAG: hypothetical protein ACMXYM_01405 [Candidatus Woesearchaeota archaeon]
MNVTRLFYYTTDETAYDAATIHSTLVENARTADRRKPQIVLSRIGPDDLSAYELYLAHQGALSATPTHWAEIDPHSIPRNSETGLYHAENDRNNQHIVRIPERETLCVRIVDFGAFNCGDRPKSDWDPVRKLREFGYID